MQNLVAYFLFIYLFFFFFLSIIFDLVEYCADVHMVVCYESGAHQYIHYTVILCYDHISLRACYCGYCV